jgi:transmembrane sensor
MNLRITDIADRFLAEKDCSRHELTEFKKWLSDSGTQPEVEKWLLRHWDISTEIDSNALIENVFRQIQDYQKVHSIPSGFSLTRILKVYQKIAAFLLIPILGLGVLYWFNQYRQVPPAVQYAETIAPRGQKSQIVLADGTRVWLNSDTKIKYPNNFNENQRDVYLDGEAFFEVSKNPHKPFFVHTSGVNVKVLGTKFNVKAYSDEDQIETSLFEGKIDLMAKNPLSENSEEKEMTQGESFSYLKTDGKLTQTLIPREEINGWKKNQLIFKDDTFSNLVKKVERWYDVQVIYDEKQFNDRRLTVELYEGERLDRLMEVIRLALSVNYKYERGKIILTPKA